MRVCFSTLLLMLAPVMSFANVHVLPREVGDYSYLTSGHLSLSPVARLQKVRCVYLNEMALKRDFPHLRGWTREQIRRWVESEGGVISQYQLGLNGIRHSEIPVIRDEKGQPRLTHAFRAHHDGRSDVVVMHDEAGHPVGLMNRKSAGVNEGGLSKNFESYGRLQNEQRPVSAMWDDGHSDGLMSLGEAIAELFRQAAAQKLFEIYNYSQRDVTFLETVETYAILLPDFELYRTSERLPVGIYLRQAHLGRLHGGYWVPSSIYVDHYGGRQADLFFAAADFGGVMITHSKLLEFFGDATSTKPGDPQYSKVWSLGHELARQVARDPEHNVDLIEHHLERILKPIANDWNVDMESRREHADFASDIRRYFTTVGRSFPVDQSELAQGNLARYHSFLTEQDLAFIFERVAGLRAAASNFLVERDDKLVGPLIDRLFASRNELYFAPVESYIRRLGGSSPYVWTPTIFRILEHVLMWEHEDYTERVALLIVHGGQQIAEALSASIREQSESNVRVASLLERLLLSDNPKVRGYAISLLDHFTHEPKSAEAREDLWARLAASSIQDVRTRLPQVRCEWLFERPQQKPLRFLGPAYDPDFMP